MLAVLLLSISIGFGIGAEVTLKVSQDLEDEFISIFSFKCSVGDYEDSNIASITLFRQTSAPRELVAYISALTPGTPFAGPGFEAVALQGQIDFESDPETFLEVLFSNLRVEDLGLYTCEVVLVDEDKKITVSTAEARVAAKRALKIVAETTVAPQETTLPVEESTTRVTIFVVEETTPEVTTVPVEETTSEVTTVLVEETTPEVTTVAEEETTPEVTTVVEEETTPDVTTFVDEETTPEVTTVVEEETTPEVTTIVDEVTTPEVTIVPVEETTPEVITIVEEETTPEVITIVEEETTPVFTTVSVEETTPEVTTVIEEETTLDVTTLSVEETTLEVTTVEDTTPEVTTLLEEETTPEVTTLLEEETTPEVTTLLEEETTPEVTTIALEETTAVPEETTVPDAGVEVLVDIVESLEYRLDSFNETVVEFGKKLAALESQKNVVTREATPEPDDEEIVSNYFVYENASYFFIKSNQIIDVNQAQAACESRRFYLTEVNDAGELKAIADEVSPHIIEEGLVIVAGQKTLDQDVWLYQGSQAQVDFFAWGPGESVQTTGGECLALRKTGQSLSMVAVPCTSDQKNFYYLCEHDD